MGVDRATVPAEVDVGNRRLGLEGAVCLGLAVVSCSGARPRQQGEDNAFDTTPAGVALATERASAVDKEAPPEKADEGGLSADQKAQLDVALRRGAAKAATCSTVVPDAPHGQGEVIVTFDGKKGRSVDARVGAPFAGTRAEACIKRAFVGEIVMPFDGELERTHPIKLEAGEAKNDGKKK